MARLKITKMLSAWEYNGGPSSAVPVAAAQDVHMWPDSQVAEAGEKLKNVFNRHSTLHMISCH